MSVILGNTPALLQRSHTLPPASAVLCRYLDNVTSNRFGVGVGVWFVGNMLTNQLISTGAFEVYYDGQLVGGCTLRFTLR